jgi:Mg-chelatase subunit ChlD
MFCLRLTSLALPLLALAACTVKVPAPRGIKVSVNAMVPVHASASVSAKVKAPPPAPVALEGAAVVEFFGVPLDGVADVVFVLDRSGSMNELALGRIAQISAAPLQAAPAPAPVVEPAPPPPAPVDAVEPPVPPAEPLPPEPPVAQAPVESPPAPIAAVHHPRKIDVAQAELIDAVQRLPLGTRMNVIFFNNRLEGFAASMIALQESDREGLIHFVRTMEPDGTTALAPAMRTAFLMSARRIVLLSDGLGNVGGDAQAVLRDAREAIRGGVRVDTIGLGSDQDAQLLEALARESGGLYQAL